LFIIINVLLMYLKGKKELECIDKIDKKEIKEIII